MWEEGIRIYNTQEIHNNFPVISLFIECIWNMYIKHLKWKIHSSIISEPKIESLFLKEKKKDCGTDINKQKPRSSDKLKMSKLPKRN